MLVIERSYEPVPVPKEALQEALQELRAPDGMTSNDNDADRLPDVYPPFGDFFPSTDSTLWVLRDLSGDAMGLDVFQPDGQYLGQVDTPVNLRRLTIRLITHDRIYATETDDLGVQRVLILRIERP